jgi:hypothetical protein
LESQNTETLVDKFFTMKRTVVTFILFPLFLTSSGQSVNQKVFTGDIDNFWHAYDSIVTTSDSLKQLQYIRELYIDKGTEGLKVFMKARDYTPELYVNLIRQYPKFWRSIRPNTLAVRTKAKEIEKSIGRLKELYPQLKEARMYFTIGGLLSGGTPVDDMVLIGTEIATGDPATDVSEFPDKWLEGVFKTHQTGNLVALNVHEYVHTQQKGEPKDLLGQAIKEGSCDFITELVIGKPLENNYIQYGTAHEAVLKQQFKEEMFTTAYSNWLYNGAAAKTVADLGYFMGYAICKSYYGNASNKRNAIRDIIELNYSDTNAAEGFLKKSGYYTEPINKAELVQKYEAKMPYVVRLEPFSNGDTNVDPSIKTLTIIFSKPMNRKRYSIDVWERGKEFAPIAGVVGFSDDGTRFTLNLDMKADHEYEFIITDKKFRSEEGYPLKPLLVKFKTR